MVADFGERFRSTLVCGLTSIIVRCEAATAAWTKLVDFYANAGGLRDTLPSRIGLGTDIRYFVPPRSPTAGKLRWLVVVDVDFSVIAFTGTIPSRIFQRISLGTAWFENNQLTGTMPLCNGKTRRQRL
jgi:hypothetical protein